MLSTFYNIIIIIMDTINDLGIKITNRITNCELLKDTTDTLLSYVGDDFKRYVKINSTEPYTKTQLFVNDILEIVLIVWTPNRSSKTHDHPTGGCILRIMEGYLMENVYVKQNNQINYVNTKQLNKNQVGYQIGDQYLHNIDNPSNDYSISLHVYSPPNFKINYY